MSAVFWIAIVPMGVVFCAALWKDHQMNEKIKSLVQKWTDE